MRFRKCLIHEIGTVTVDLHILIVCPVLRWIEIKKKTKFQTNDNYKEKRFNARCLQNNIHSGELLDLCVSCENLQVLELRIVYISGNRPNRKTNVPIPFSYLVSSRKKLKKPDGIYESLQVFDLGIIQTSGKRPNQKTNVPIRSILPQIHK